MPFPKPKLFNIPVWEVSPKDGGKGVIIVARNVDEALYNSAEIVDSASGNVKKLADTVLVAEGCELKF